MTKEEILENNNLIAEFMNLKLYNESENGWRTLISLHYHESWNWLIPVISKCYSKDIKNTEYFSHVNIGILHDDSELAFYGVSEFIKWYNQDK